MSRIFIAVGLLLVAVGVLWPWITRLGLGRLPGDIVIQRDGFRFYFPIVTCILISVVLSAVLWLFRRYTDPPFRPAYSGVCGGSSS